MDFFKTSRQPAEDGDDTTMLSRRRMLGLAATGPVVLLGISAAARANPPAAAACFDMNALPSGQVGMRKALNYKLVATDPNKKCGLCAFYHVTAGDCGKCDILSGGPTSAASVCDSWAKKAS